MKLLPKFSLLFVGLFGSGLLLAGWISYNFLQQNARKQILAQAELMMETTLSTRNYTNVQIKPLLKPKELPAPSFPAQTVPAYAATEVFNYLRKKYPSYAYKEATLNPTNPRDRAVDWESDVINIFRNDPSRKEVVGERDTPDGRSLYLARPISAPPACLECHSTPDKAPAAMIAIYGPNNGFGWKPDEIIGAQIVSVPMAVPIKAANDAFQSLVFSLILVAIGTLGALNVALIAIVIRPVTKLSEMADQISKGNLDVPELPVRGNDEIATLAGSFNRMYLSLVKAIRMLEE